MEAWSRLIAQSYTTAGIHSPSSCSPGVAPCRPTHGRRGAGACRPHGPMRRPKRPGTPNGGGATRYLRDRIAPLLQDLAEGRADPGDEGGPAIERHRGGATAQAVRRDGGRGPSLAARTARLRGRRRTPGRGRHVRLLPGNCPTSPWRRAGI
ncbi:hypothetical protein LV779_27195 [Streptomyces thinghirensis]|nr:hypothetical protein [Streptomyces thinghirensis]